MGKKHKSDIPNNPWYKCEDLEALFDCCDRTIWAWVAAGKLPQPIRRGKKWSRWPRVQIDALVAAMTAHATTDPVEAYAGELRARPAPMPEPHRAEHVRRLMELRNRPALNGA